MLMFEINLLKGRAISASARKAMFWGLSLYLVLCIVALAYLANWGTQRLIRAARLRRSVDQQENTFRRSHPRAKDVLDFARRSESRLLADAKSLESIDGMIRHRVNLVAVISALTAPLPPGVHLLNFELNARLRALTFDVAVPAGGMEHRISGGQLVALWNADDALKDNLQPVRAVSTKRNRVLGRSALIMRFSAELKQR